jgi:glutamate-ammonia-ligase adenylyltransferase
LATSFAEFDRYFLEGQGQLWERQALCKARIIVGQDEAAGHAIHSIQTAAFDQPFGPGDAEAIREMRWKIEAASTPTNLKRGIGGLCDIDFLVQMLQLKYGQANSELRQSSTLAALAALYKAGRLCDDDYQFFASSYRFLRTVELRLRLMSTTARDSLPDDPAELARLARVLGFANEHALLAEVHRFTSQNRARFEQIFAANAESAVAAG